MSKRDYAKISSTTFEHFKNVLCNDNPFAFISFVKLPDGTVKVGSASGGDISRLTWSLREQFNFPVKKNIPVIVNPKEAQ